MKPILHTDIHREMDSSLAPEQVANILETQIPTISLDETGSGITFQHQTEDILIDGIIQRWQGTESHIEIVAELSPALLSNTRRDTVIGLVVGGAVIISYFIVHFLIFLILWISVLGFIWAMRKYDPKPAKRWQVQQQLAVVTEEILDHIQQQEIDSHTIDSLSAESDADNIEINQAKRASSSNV